MIGTSCCLLCPWQHDTSTWMFTFRPTMNKALKCDSRGWRISQCVLYGVCVCVWMCVYGVDREAQTYLQTALLLLWLCMNDKWLTYYNISMHLLNTAFGIFLLTNFLIDHGDLFLTKLKKTTALHQPTLLFCYLHDIWNLPNINWMITYFNRYEATTKQRSFWRPTTSIACMSDTFYIIVILVNISYSSWFLSINRITTVRLIYLDFLWVCEMWFRGVVNIPSPSLNQLLRRWETGGWWDWGKGSFRHWRRTQDQERTEPANTIHVSIYTGTAFVQTLPSHHTCTHRER